MEYNNDLKVHGPIFQIYFSVSFEESSLQRCKSEISVETVKLFRCKKQFCILQLPVSYCVSLIDTITRHIFINIFQMECFSAVKFGMGHEKNMSFLVIAKSPKVWKKIEKVGLGSLSELVLKRPAVFGVYSFVHKICVVQLTLAKMRLFCPKLIQFMGNHWHSHRFLWFQQSPSTPDQAWEFSGKSRNFLVKIYAFSFLFMMFWAFLTRFPAFLLKVILMPARLYKV